MATAEETLADWALSRFPGCDPGLVAQAAREVGPLLGALRDPGRILAGIDLLRASGDPLVAPGTLFLERQEHPHHEQWPYPITIHSILEIPKGRLLALPPGSRKYGLLHETIPEIVDAQLAARFPRLLAEIANRPNLFFPGVFFPSEIEVREIELASALHGATYVSTCEFALAGDERTASVCLKPAPMGVEAIVSHTLRVLNRRATPSFEARWGLFCVPGIVAIEERYGILERIAGRNGVELLPRGISTGALSELRRNEYPEDLAFTREEVFQIAREFAKQAVLAYYLRLFDRKPDQMIFSRDGKLSITHIDFGRGLKKNYALPWKRHYDPSRAPLAFEDPEIPYFEAAGGLLYLPHFIPAAHRDLTPWEGPLRAEIEATFLAWAGLLRENAQDLRESFAYLQGHATQYREEEVFSRLVGPDDLDSVYTGLEALDEPRETIRSILSLAKHELLGTTDTTYERDATGERIVRLTPRREDPDGYDLRDPRDAGRFRKDPEEKTLEISFGAHPAHVLARLAEGSLPRLARAIAARGTRLSGLDLSVRIDGVAEARWSQAGSAARTRVTLPREIRSEIAGVWAPRASLPEDFVQVRDALPDRDFWREELLKLDWILADDLTAPEALSFLVRIEPEGAPLRLALEEIAKDLYGVGDFLLDKDPFDTGNAFLNALGRKYGFVPPLAPDDLPEASAAHPDLARAVLSLFAPATFVPHRVHFLLLARLAAAIAERSGFTNDESRLLHASVLLHDLNVLDPSFRRVLLEPGGRTFTRFHGQALEAHPAITCRVLHERISAGDLRLPDDVPRDLLLSTLASHHRPIEAGATRVEQVVHLADALAVFGDGARPESWSRGPLPLSESGPRWIQAQRERGQVSSEVARAALSLFAESPGRELLSRLDAVSHPYLSAANALHLVALLRWGLHPQNPGLRQELFSRYGKENIERLWGRVIRSNLPVREKVQVLSRIDDLAPLFERLDLREHRFLNASARPVQRTVERIVESVRRGETVILTGFFPRAVKAFRRTRETLDLAQEEIERIVVACGTKRLQFIQYSYPYEAEFDRPFHEVIAAHRKRTGAAERIVLIPFARFFEALPARRKGAAPSSGGLARLDKTTRSAPEIPERVAAEARRFLRYFAGRTEGGGEAGPDAREAERFRRILLDGYTNREVLHFYAATSPKDSPLRDAFADGLEALHENPNYLSDRSFYYGLHEITKSLSLIHLPRPVVGPDVIPPPRPELAFALPLFETAARVGAALGGSPAVVQNLRLASAMMEDETIQDWLVSPEDLRTNATLRDLLRTNPRDLTARILARGGAALSPPEEEIFHASLYLSFRSDRFRIENWREAEILPRLPESLPPAAAAALRELSLAGSDAVVLYNGLSLAAELRFGLSPRGLDITQNVRTLHGVGTAERILDAIVASPLNARDRVKFARKFRIWASMLAGPAPSGCASIPSRVRFLNCDRIGYGGTIFGIPFPGAFREEDETLWILTGSYRNARAFLSEASAALPAETFSRLSLAVSEETLVLLKEASLEHTDAIRARLRALREETGTQRRRFLAPARILLDLPAPNIPRPPSGDPSYRSLTAWVNRFD